MAETQPLRLEFQNFNTPLGDNLQPSGRLNSAAAAQLSPPAGFESQPLLANSQSSATPSDNPQPTGPLWSLSYYSPYFNINTKEVLERLLYAIWPFKSSMYEMPSVGPDLYGPFWICTTLIFFMAVGSNFGRYLSFIPTDQEEWNYDFSKLTLGATLVYGYMALVPVGAWTLYKYFDAQISFVETLSLYGYSMLPFVPISIICIAPSEVLRWLLVLLALAFSSAFLYLNFRMHLPAQGAYILVSLAALCHLIFILILKIYLF